MNAIACVVAAPQIALWPADDVRRLRGFCRRIERLVGEMAQQTQTERASQAMTVAIEALHAVHQEFAACANGIENEAFEAAL